MACDTVYRCRRTDQAPSPQYRYPAKRLATVSRQIGPTQSKKVGVSQPQLVPYNPQIENGPNQGIVSKF